MPANTSSALPAHTRAKTTPGPKNSAESGGSRKTILSRWDNETKPAPDYRRGGAVGQVRAASARMPATTGRKRKVR
jgi:hypothetical protein